MTKELEPCPACGNKSPSEKMSKLPNGMWMSEIECLDEAPAVAFTSMGVGETPEQAHEMAVDNWNTRYKRTCKDISSSANDFTCSECGAELEIAPMKPIGKHETHEFVAVSFCSSCGSEVIQ